MRRRFPVHAENERRIVFFAHSHFSACNIQKLIYNEIKMLSVMRHES